MLAVDGEGTVIDGYHIIRVFRIGSRQYVNVGANNIRLGGISPVETDCTKVVVMDKACDCTGEDGVVLTRGLAGIIDGDGNRSLVDGNRAGF